MRVGRSTSATERLLKTRRVEGSKVHFLWLIRGAKPRTVECQAPEPIGPRESRPPRVNWPLTGTTGAGHLSFPESRDTPSWSLRHRKILSKVSPHRK